MTATIELPQGALDLLILQTLALDPQHGCASSWWKLTAARAQVLGTM